MIKLNAIRWLKTLKFCLLISSIFFLTSSFIIFINYFVSYTTYTNNFEMLIGAYESSMIDESIVSDFSMRLLYKIVYSILCFVIVIWICLSSVSFYLDKYCIFKSWKSNLLILTVYIIIFIILSILVLNTPFINSIDLNASQITPQPLAIGYNFTISDKLVNFILNPDGIIIIIILSFLQTISVGMQIFKIIKIIQHRYF